MSEQAAPTAPLQPCTVSSRNGSPGELPAARCGGTGPEHPLGAAPYITGNYLRYKTRLKGPQVPECHRKPGQHQQPGQHAASRDGCTTSPTFPGREDAPFCSAAAAAAIQTAPCPRPSLSPIPTPPREPHFGAQPPGRGARPLHLAAGCRLSSPPGALRCDSSSRERAKPAQPFSQRRLFAPGRLRLPVGLSSATRSRSSRAGQSLGAAPMGAGRSEGRGRPGGTRGAGGERRPREESRSAAHSPARGPAAVGRSRAAPQHRAETDKSPPPHPEKHRGTAARGRAAPPHSPHGPAGRCRERRAARGRRRAQRSRPGLPAAPPLLGSSARPRFLGLIAAFAFALVSPPKFAPRRSAPEPPLGRRYGSMAAGRGGEGGGGAVEKNTQKKGLKRKKQKTKNHHNHNNSPKATQAAPAGIRRGEKEKYTTATARPQRGAPGRRCSGPASSRRGSHYSNRGPLRAAAPRALRGDCPAPPTPRPPGSAAARRDQSSREPRAAARARPRARARPPRPAPPRRAAPGRGSAPRVRACTWC